MIYLARDILNMSAEDIHNQPDEVVEIEFDDGVLLTHWRHTKFTWFLWQVLKEFPHVSMSSDLHLHPHLDANDGYLTPKMSINILSLITERIHDQATGPYDRETRDKAIYQCSGDLYNYLVTYLTKYTTSSNIEDYLELYMHGVVTDARKDVQPNQTSIDVNYKRIEDALLHARDLDHNNIAIAARSRCVNIDPINQIIFLRGFMSDICSTVFKYPIMTGYFEGITTLENSMKESRGAAKALAWTEKPLKTSEYLNRKLQLAAGSVIDLIEGDCGSEKYLTITLDKTIMRGSHRHYYKMDEDGPLLRLDKNDKSMIGKTILKRSATMCKHRGNGGVCYTCLGDISYSIPKGTALGHTSVVEFVARGSQLIMSIKHYDGSSVVLVFEISELEKNFMRAGTTDDTIRLNPVMKKLKPKLLLPIGVEDTDPGVQGIIGLPPNTDKDLLHIFRLTKLNEAEILIEDSKSGFHEIHKITPSMTSRLGSLSKEMVAHILDHGYELTDNGKMVVDLEHWDYDLPFVKVPLRHLSTLDFLSGCESFIRSPAPSTSRKVGYTGPKLTEYADVSRAVTDLFNQVNEKMDVGMHHLEVIALTMMTPGDNKLDFNLPDYDRPVRFEKFDTIMNNRSFTGVAAYKGGTQYNKNVRSLIKGKRQRHLLDPIFYTPDMVK